MARLEVIGRSSVALVWMAACAQPPATPHNRNGSYTQAEVFARVADQALAAALQPDYHRPFEPSEIDYGPLRAKYLVACRAGDRRSCWMVPQLRDPTSQKRDASADGFLAMNCLAGDVMSCRALPKDLEVPGSLGSMVRSKGCHDGSHCDGDILRVECLRGIPESCGLAYAYVRDETERVALRQRYIDLSIDGCKQGLLDECEVVHSLDYKSSEVAGLLFSRVCLVMGTDCDDAAHNLGATTIAARDMLERTCQVTANEFRRNMCWNLLKAYAAHSFPEPVPNRFSDLREWYCRAPVFLTSEICGDSATRAP